MSSNLILTLLNLERSSLDQQYTPLLPLKMETASVNEIQQNKKFDSLAMTFSVSSSSGKQPPSMAATEVPLVRALTLHGPPVVALLHFAQEQSWYNYKKKNEQDE